MKTSLLIKLFPAYAVIVILIIMAAVNTWQKSNFNKSQLNFLGEITKKQDAENISSPKLITGNPVEIIIPSVGIKAKVVPGEYDLKTKNWIVSKTNAHFAAITALPNNKSGNTLIYAHNTNNLFGPTKNLKLKDKIILNTENKHVFIYEYESDQNVLPDNLEIFRYEGKPRLTLLTCAGFWDKERRLMYFKLIKAI